MRDCPRKVQCTGKNKLLAKSVGSWDHQVTIVYRDWAMYFWCIFGLSWLLMLSPHERRIPNAILSLSGNQCSLFCTYSSWKRSRSFAGWGRTDGLIYLPLFHWSCFSEAFLLSHVAHWIWCWLLRSSIMCYRIVCVADMSFGWERLFNDWTLFMNLCHVFVQIQWA